MTLRSAFVALLAASIGTASLCHCSNETFGTAMGAADGGSTEGGSPDGAVATDGGGNLALVGGDFEQDCQGSRWTTGGTGTLVADPVAHSGSKSCRVCWNGTGTTYSVENAAAEAVVPGAVYVGEAWLRIADGASAGSIEATMKTAPDTDPSSSTDYGMRVAMPPLTTTWEHVTASVTAVSATQFVSFGMLAQAADPDGGPGSSCFLIDDVTIRRTH